MDRYQKSSLLKSTISSHDSLEYVADRTSVESDTGSQPRLLSNLFNDDEISEDEPGLSPDFYRAHANKINGVKTMNIYAESTNLQLNNIESQWRQYCELIKEDPEDFMKSITAGDVSSFFMWKLKQKQGTAGRRLRGIKTASSLDTYRKMFLGVYRRLVGEDMDSHLQRSTLHVTNELAQQFGLSREPREKPCMDAKDVLEIIQTTLTTVEKKFQLSLGCAMEMLKSPSFEIQAAAHITS
ncbi:hypothetical protein J3E74DRAFT_295818 [Bipolaris maydis]|nr:hypothetical protein J3E74DRAFT_295818 [Bipolaris maydis]